MSGDVRSTDQGPVRVLEISRPERRNALTAETADALAAELRSAEADPSIGAVMLTGSGDTFSSGGDAEAILEAATDDSGAAAVAVMSRFHRLITGIWTSELPVVAAVSGIAYGGGANLALVCDLVICSEEARFCQVFLRRGLVPDLAGAYLLPRLAGLQRAKELMLLTGEISAVHARELGLVNAVLPDPEQARAHALELATRLAEGPRPATALTKKLINTGVSQDLPSFLGLELTAQTAALRSPAARDSFRAFLSRRDRTS